MEEEDILIPMIVVAIGVLVSLIAIDCKRKLLSKQSHQTIHIFAKSIEEGASGRHQQEPQNEISKTRPSASYECTECQRFDEEVDGALKAKTGIKIVNKDGRCCINEHEISSKKCEHGIGENVITINKPELQMSTYVGNGVVMEVNKRKFTIKRTYITKARSVAIYGNINCCVMRVNGRVICDGNIDVNNFNIGHTIGSNFQSNECSECSKYDEQIAETTKATIIRDKSGKMNIISSTCMDIVNQNVQTFINGNKIKSKSCQHRDINCCSIYYSSNIKGIKNSSISDSKNINAKECNISDSINVTGSGCNISDCKDVNGKRCNISDCKNVTGNDCKVNDCRGVIGRNCIIRDSKNVNAENCKIIDCSNVTAKDCTIRDCSGVVAENSRIITVYHL